MKFTVRIATCLVIPALLALSAGCGTLKPINGRSKLPENFLRLSSRIFSSAEPEGNAAFAALKQEGIHTIVSVDGASPEVATARRHGLHYVHLPMGYDGIPAETAAAFEKVLQTTQGKVLVHCHHGKHRGPSAAVIACMIEGSKTNEKALATLKAAGTSPDYAGLWRDVRAFHGVPAGTVFRPLVEQSDISALATAMVSTDEAFEKLEHALRPPSADVRQANESAALLVEGFRESARFAKMDHGDSRRIVPLENGQAKAQRLAAFIKSSQWSEARTLHASLKADCRTCHVRFRN